MTTVAFRAGVARGLVELRQAFTGTALLGQLLWPAATVAALWYFRDHRLPGGGTLGAFILPSVLGTYVAVGAVLMIQYLATEREDGTLLRARIIPDGIQGYLTGKLVTVSGSVAIYLVLVAVPGALLVHGLAVHRVGAWLTLAWVVPLGFVATQSIGATLGALVSGTRAIGYLSALVMGLISISGIFYPITALPRWLQWVAQAFPIYWLGLGMRSAVLPAGAVAAELGRSWRPLETAVALSIWTALGLTLAPVVLRRAARRESTATVTRRRDRALRRTR
ncbi:ABC transporter permease [Nocardia aurantia]|uniref:ABC-2 type transporter transmembrane domain-containing protein n=1 Tax=Nocardia aurantia TaxID=2585199 RepID=A0A7K0DSN6_9NOCA|nr:ABC transporter permease [Nocardia aurantia]MQY28761.1 hypothetical protein [Nocardia aurantia]